MFHGTWADVVVADFGELIVTPSPDAERGRITRNDAADMRGVSLGPVHIPFVGRRARRNSTLAACWALLSDRRRFINHSGQYPNLVLRFEHVPSAEEGHGQLDGNVEVVAARDIMEGEEVTFDYGEE